VEFSIGDYRIWVSKPFRDVELVEVEILRNDDCIVASTTVSIFELSDFLLKTIKENEMYEFGYCRVDFGLEKEVDKNG